MKERAGIQPAETAQTWTRAFRAERGSLVSDSKHFPSSIGPLVTNRWTPYLVLLMIVIAVSTRSFWTSPGVPMYGDWVAVSRTYLTHVATIWNAYERNGVINIDLRQLPWIAALGLASGFVGDPQFRFVNDMFIVAVLALPPTVVFILASGQLGISRWISLLVAVLYGFNPWVAGQLAAGHISMLLGYGLLPALSVTPFFYRGRRFVIRASLLITALAALDVHITFLALIVLAGTMLSTRRTPRAVMSEVGGLLVVTTALCAYWLLPAVAVLRRIRNVPGSIDQSVSGQAVLAQMADPIHVLSGRSDWWPQFANGLFDYGAFTIVVEAGLLLLPACVILRAITSPARRRTKMLPGGPALSVAYVLLSFGIVPQLFARDFPNAYAMLGGLPLGALFRDVTDWTPLYIIGLAGLALGGAQWKGILTGAAVIACVVSLVPWTSGDLRGDIRPLYVSDGQVEAITWLNAQSSPETRTLWLPLEPYQQFPWSSSSLISDPARYWSDQKLLNSIVDPAYDAFPGTSASLLNLNAVIANGLPSGELASVLAHAGVRWIAVKGDVESDDLTKQQILTLERSQGISLTKTFGAVQVFHVDRVIRADVQAADGVALFDGGWRTLGKASQVDAGLQRVYVEPSNPGSLALFDQSPNSVLMMGSNLWDSYFALGPILAPPHASGRATFPFDPGYGYAFENGETFAFASKGIAAVRVLGADTDFTVACEGQGPRSAPIVDQQPKSEPRWYAVQCLGNARAYITGHVFIQGYKTFNQSDFVSRLDLFMKAMQRGGSAYVIDAAPSGVETVRLPQASAGTTSLATLRSNPLLIPKGRYSFSVVCTPSCMGGTITLSPPSPSGWAGALGQEYSTTAGFMTTPVRIPRTSSDATIADVPAGIYGLAVDGVHGGVVNNIIVARYPSGLAHSRAVGTLSQTTTNNLPPGPIIAINQSSGPWLITSQTGAQIELVPADLVGSAYRATGPTRVTLTPYIALEVAGALATILAIILIALLSFWSSTGRRRA
jgi:hypothetical protein